MPELIKPESKGYIMSLLDHIKEILGIEKPPPKPLPKPIEDIKAEIEAEIKDEVEEEIVEVPKPPEKPPILPPEVRVSRIEDVLERLNDIVMYISPISSHLTEIIKLLKIPQLLRRNESMVYRVKEETITIPANKKEKAVDFTGTGLFLSGYIEIINDTSGVSAECGVEVHLDGLLKENLTIKKLYDLNIVDPIPEGAWLSNYDPANGDYSITWSPSKSLEFKSSFKIILTNKDTLNHDIHYKFRYIPLTF